MDCNNCVVYKLLCDASEAVGESLPSDINLHHVCVEDCEDVMRVIFSCADICSHKWADASVKKTIFINKK